MDKELFLLVLAVYMGVSIVLIVKLILFKKTTRNRTLKNFFYFTTGNIYNSDTQRKSNLKRLQNNLTLLLIITLILALIFTELLFR